MKKEQYYNKTLEDLYKIYQSKDYRFHKLCKQELLLMLPISLFIPIPLEKAFIISSLGYLFKKTYDILDYLYNYDEFYLNSVEYQEAYKIYKVILEELSLLFKKIDCDDEIKIFAAYYYLIRNGYLSINHEFYHKKDVDLFIGINGANIVDGFGNSINISSMLTDILSGNSYNACNVEMLLKNSDELLKFNCDNLDSNLIEDRVNDKNFFDFVIRNLSKLGGNKFNHLVTLVKNSDFSYVLDPTYNAMYMVGDNNNFVYNGESSYGIRYDSYFDLDQHNKLNKTSCELVDGLNKEYYDVYCNCSRYVDLFEVFYREHKSLYEELVVKKKVLAKESFKYGLY